MRPKHLFILLLLSASIVLSSCQSHRQQSFSFRNGITWNSTASDIGIAEGDSASNPSLSYEDIPVSNYLADSLIYHFTENNEFVAVRYFFRKDMAEEDINNIEESITAKYGNPSSPDIIATIKLMDIVKLDTSTLSNDHFHENYVNWKLSDGTIIATWTDRRGYQILYINGALLSEQLRKPNTLGL